MIFTGAIKGKLINPKYVVSLTLSKGADTVFITGEAIEAEIKVDTIDLKHSWTIIIETTKGNSYINHRDFERALDELLDIAGVVYPDTDRMLIERKMRNIYERK